MAMLNFTHVLLSYGYPMFGTKTRKRNEVIWLGITIVAILSMVGYLVLPLFVSY